MATVNFYLKNSSEKSETLIYLLFRYNGQKLKYSTGEKINPKNWNPEKQRAKKTMVGSPEFNSYLDKLESETLKIYRTLISNDIALTPDTIKTKLNESLQKEPKNTQTFFTLFEQYIEQSKTLKKETTIKKYNTLISYLKQLGQKKNLKIEFEKIDTSFYSRFIDFLIKDKGQTNNTVGKYIQSLKTFLHWATDNGFNKKFDFRKFKVLKEETAIITLTNEELNTLAQMDLRKNKRLENVRDTFLFGCYTGLRFSDIAKLKPDHIKGDFIISTTYKTKTNDYPALSPLAKEVLQKHQNKLPIISNQKMNDYLKELCKIAEIDESTQITRYKGNLRIDTTLPKYEFIGTHTARRTFVTLSLEKGIPAEVVKKQSGHKSDKSFRRYVNITNKVKLVELNKHWDIKPKLMAI